MTHRAWRATVQVRKSAGQDLANKQWQQWGLRETAGLACLQVWPLDQRHGIT